MGGLQALPNSPTCTSSYGKLTSAGQPHIIFDVGRYRFVHKLELVLKTIPGYTPTYTFKTNDGYSPKTVCKHQFYYNAGTTGTTGITGLTGIAGMPGTTPDYFTVTVICNSPGRYVSMAGSTPKDTIDLCDVNVFSDAAGEWKFYVILLL